MEIIILNFSIINKTINAKIIYIMIANPISVY